MRITDRDIRLLKDIALSQVLSRDQIIQLGYFTSISRCNRTLERLCREKLVSVCRMPFISQHLYLATSKCGVVVGERIVNLIAARHATPRFIQHSLSVTDVRLALIATGCSEWRFEAQLRHEFSWGKRQFEVRPDGLIHRDGLPVLVEVDLGHVSAPKFGKKLDAFRSYWLSGTFEATYNTPTMRVLTVTTGSLRLKHLAALGRQDPCFEFTTFEELGVASPGGWI